MTRTFNPYMSTEKTKTEDVGCMCDWCEICGTRKCRDKHHPKFVDGALVTEYTREFPPKRAVLERRHPDMQVESAPLKGATSYTTDFPPKAAGPAKSYKPANAPLASPPLDTATTYGKEFVKKPIPQPRPPPGPDCTCSPPFIGVSSYNADYVRKPIAERPERVERPMLSLPFNGATEYKDQFIKKRTVLERPQPQPMVPSVHRDNITSYGHDLVPKPFPLPPHKCCDNPSHSATKLFMTEGLRNTRSLHTTGYTSRRE